MPYNLFNPAVEKSLLTGQEMPMSFRITQVKQSFNPSTFAAKISSINWYPHLVHPNLVPETFRCEAIRYTDT